ncbi:MULTISPECIES: Xaa-Pro peptidase family protein [unclassified Rathayibacter]|uniref:M24 family metallopeptidase n=1 Tax=unclassified Rathayibacter TaxID=2609250 RepID=UPI0021A876E9|nr:MULTISPECIES: M24 family metallopeptidase [unclassified Rathayibacter]
MRRILADREAEAIALTSPGAVGWLLAGARVQVSLAGDPVVAVVVTADEETVFVFANEVDRLQQEELPPGVETALVRWDHSLLPPHRRAGAAGVLHEQDILAALRAARAALVPDEIERYSRLCRDSAALMTKVLADVRPEHSERSVTARLAHAVQDVGADVLVALGAGRSRLGFRHPLPTSAPVGDLAMFVLCARRDGLIANLTRWVRFGPASVSELDAQKRILSVEADYFAATRAGSVLADVFAAGCAAYSRHGFAADEWTRHHQGGPCGYNGRDPRASADVPDLIVLDQAFAWNPSAPGVKVEDTVLLTENGIRVLTADPGWPTVTVGGIARPTVWEL